MTRVLDIGNINRGLRTIYTMCDIFATSRRGEAEYRRFWHRECRYIDDQRQKCLASLDSLRALGSAFAWNELTATSRRGEAEYRRFWHRECRYIDDQRQKCLASLDSLRALGSAFAWNELTATSRRGEANTDASGTENVDISMIKGKNASPRLIRFARSARRSLGMSSLQLAVVERPIQTLLALRM